MRDELGNYKFFNKKSSESYAGKQALKTLVSAISGLADWIGLGSTFRGWLENTPYADIKETDLNNIKTKLATRINALIQKDEIDLDKLQSKLDSLASMGFSLTGIARDRYNETVKNTMKTVQNQRAKLAKTTNWATLAQSEVDSLKSIQETLDPDDLWTVKDKVADIERKIGDYSNYGK